jgi:phenylacetate-CoA ligase
MSLCPIGYFRLGVYAAIFGAEKIPKSKLMKSFLNLKTSLFWIRNKPMRLLDSLRGRYATLPYGVRRRLSPMLALMPPTLIYGATYRKLRADIDRSRTDAAFTRDYQLRSLRALVGAAAERSPYYQRMLVRIFGEIPDINRFEFEDLQRLPILDREDVAREPKTFLVEPEEAVDIRQTSGSSNRQPLKVFLDKTRGVKEQAFVHHVWSQISYRPGDQRAALWGSPSYITAGDTVCAYDASLREVWLSPEKLSTANLDLYLEALHRYKIAFLHGLPSAMTILAGHARRRGWQRPGTLRGILPISETLFAHQRRLLEDVFGVPIISYYGLTERLAFAGELREHPDIYEFEPLYGYTELVDEAGRQITEAGRSGRVVSTGFLSRAMPLLRYDTGDTAVLERPAALENSYRMRVTGLRSRWSQEFVVGRNGELISMAALLYQSHYSVIQEYQFYQDTPGRTVFRAVPCPGVSMERVRALAEEMCTEVLAVTPDVVERIPASRTGKRRFVDQRLDLHHFGWDLG